MSTAETLKRRPGRPKGSTTQPQPVVHTFPARCPRCGSTSHTVVKHLGEQVFAGVTTGGDLYTSIIRRRVRCDSCQQVFVKAERAFDPAQWRGSKT